MQCVRAVKNYIECLQCFRSEPDGGRAADGQTLWRLQVRRDGRAGRTRRQIQAAGTFYSFRANRLRV